jgi:hypothetical protein
MRAKCLANSGSALTESHWKLGDTAKTEYWMTVDKEYVVYAVCLVDGGFLKYLVYDETNRPRWYFADLFTVTCDHIPSNWLFHYVGKNPEGTVQALWGFEELVREPGFFDGLVDQESEHLKIFFQKRKPEMDLEFATPNVTACAKWLDDNWVQCESCADAWQPPRRFPGMGRCPYCQTVQRIELR